MPAQRVTEHIRDHALSVGYWPRPVPDIDGIKESQWCDEFENLMRNRLIMGAFRYGLLENGSGKNRNNIDSMIQRLELYRQTGNMEHLVDVANLALVEYKCGSHPKRHWGATDDGVHTEVVGG